MHEFFQPTSVGLLVCCAVLWVGLLGLTAVVWDRRGWVVVRITGPIVSFGMLAVVALIAVNLNASLFVSWTDVWGYLL